MLIIRLSSAAAAVRSWLQSRKQLALRHQQDLAECRRLRDEIRNLQAALDVKRDVQAIDKQTSDEMIQHLTSIIKEQEQELLAKTREIERLESQVKQDQQEVTGQARINAALITTVDRLIAQNVAMSTKAVNGHMSSGVEELL